MKQQIVETLQKSTINDQQVIRKVEENILFFSSNQNYCLILMEIVDDQNLSLQIRLAALIQLKNNIERRWVQLTQQSTPNKITPEEKHRIRQALLRAMIRCQGNQLLVRMYQKITTLIVMFDCKNWMPTQQVVNVLQTQPQNLNVTVLFVQSVIQAFSQRYLAPKEPIEQFIKQVLILLYKSVTGELKNILLIYLVIKTVAKAYKLPLNDTLKQYTPHWMPLIKQVIDYEDAALSQNCQKGTLGFYLNKAKKWASKIECMFFRSHVYLDYTKLNEQFVNDWVNKYGAQFLRSSVMALSKSNLSKTYYHHFKSLFFALSKHAFLVVEYADKLLYQIIPPFAKLVPQDEELAKNDPLQLFKKEEDVLGLDGDPKYAAINLWQSLVQYGSDSKKNKIGPSYKKSLEWIYNQICSGDLITKEMAMNLFSRTGHFYLKYPSHRGDLATIIQKAVLPLLSATNVLLVRARAIEVIQYYGRLEFSTQTIKSIIEYLYQFLMMKDQPLINIKAAEAFNSILSHKIALDLVKPYLKELLQAYVKLISQNQIQNLVAGLEEIVENYGEDIAPFAIDLVNYLSSQFCKFVKQIQDNKNEQVNDEGQIDLAAQACLDVLKKVLSSGINKQVLQQTESSIVLVIQEALIHGDEFYQGAIKVLHTYLNRTSAISPRLWFFYPCVLYSIHGIPNEFKTKQLANYNPRQVQVINALCNDFNIVYFQISTVCIRNFITKSPNDSIHSKDMFDVPILRIILSIFQKTFEQHKENKNPQGVLNCASIMMCILENQTQETNLMRVFWNILGNTIKQVKSITGVKISLQVMGLMLYNNMEATISIMESHGDVSLNLIKSVIKNIKQYTREYEMTRIIIGISSILLKRQKSQKIIELLPHIFVFISKMMKKLIDQRLKIHLSDDDSDFEQDADDVCYWTQDRKLARTPLDDIDAAEFFQKAFQQSLLIDPTMQDKLKGSLNATELAELQKNITDAKTLFQQQRSSNYAC